MADYTVLHDALIDWLTVNRTDLPWRRTGDPYAIWLSEVMLQQTQVATVVPYFERFMARFPTVEALATAYLDEVLKLWEGLGYYSRARNLHRAAQIIVNKHGGAFPQTVHDLQQLPGVGPYTAGAVASLAFGVDAPAVDGNVMRVLTRLFNIEDDITRGKVRRKLWDIAGKLLPAGQAGAWNEGLMELGRRICKPQAPACDSCPLGMQCAARRLGVEEARPVRSARSRKPHYDVVAGIMRHKDGRILIVRRPADGLLGGLWDLPGGRLQGEESPAEGLQRIVQAKLGLEVNVGAQVTTLRHAYTHFRITLQAFECEYDGTEPQSSGAYDAWAWAAPAELGADGIYALPVTAQKVLAVLPTDR